MTLAPGLGSVRGGRRGVAPARRRPPCHRGGGTPEPRSAPGGHVREHPAGRPVYSTLLHVNPLNFSEIIGDLATEWKASADGLTYTFKPNDFKTHVVGSGPFTFKNYTRGGILEGERNPDYFVKDRPHLDGYKSFISTETAVRAAAIRSGRAYVEFRDLPSAAGPSRGRSIGPR